MSTRKASMISHPSYSTTNFDINLCLIEDNK